MHYATSPIPVPEDATVRYSIDQKKSSLTVRAFVTGLLSSLGHNPVISASSLEGEVLFDPGNLERSSLWLKVQASSLTATNDISSKDRDEIDRRMHDEVLESDSYPEIAFESTKITASKIGEGQYWANLAGDLTLHGVSHSQSIPVRISIDGERLRAMGDFSARQSDYQIAPVTAVGGTIRLKDELKFSFDVSATKQTGN